MVITVSFTKKYFSNNNKRLCVIVENSFKTYLWNRRLLNNAQPSSLLCCFTFSVSFATLLVRTCLNLKLFILLFVLLLNMVKRYCHQQRFATLSFRCRQFVGMQWMTLILKKKDWFVVSLYIFCPAVMVLTLPILTKILGNCNVDQIRSELPFSHFLNAFSY